MLNKLFFLVYDDDAATGDVGDTTNTGDTNTGDTTNTDTSAESNSATKTLKTFTQEEINRMLADEKRKHQDKISKHITELQALKESKNLNEKEKSDLQERIEALQRDSMTKEQLAIKDREKIKSELTQKLTSTESERDLWRNRFMNQTILRAISDASSAQEAYNPEQIIALLQPQTNVIEELDTESRPTGNFIPKVKLQDVGTDGKPVTLDLTVSEAIKRMKDMPEKYGNLFKSTAQGGLGMGQGTSRSKQKRPQDMSVEEYQKWRKENLKG